MEFLTQLFNRSPKAGALLLLSLAMYVQANYEKHHEDDSKSDKNTVWDTLQEPYIQFGIFMACLCSFMFCVFVVMFCLCIVPDCIPAIRQSEEKNTDPEKQSLLPDSLLTRVLCATFCSNSF